MIIGITARNGSGKDTAAQILVEQGFTHYSISDFLREEFKKRGKQNITTEDLRNLGEELRKKYGTGALAEKALEKIKTGNYVITSIRNPGEVDVLRKRKDFILININASPEIRYERMKQRAKNENKHLIQTFEDFKKLEQQDESKDPTQLQTNKVIQMADYKIDNNSTIEELKHKINQFLKTYNLQ